MHRRFAVYYAPPAGGALARLGATWLGRDAETGATPVQPEGLAALTAAPRRYGLHGTLKPPLRLAEGCTAEGFVAAVAALAARCAPVDLGPLRLRRIGGFLALVPDPQPAALEALAARVVADLDGFRAPAPEAELARRRAAGLSPRQEALLLRWGYPYVMEEFRFHVTLTERLADDGAGPVLAAAQAHFTALDGAPQRIEDLAVFGEDDAGVFHLLTRVPLTG
ncbi:MAG: DUF1045 domain-containing protein [Alkalilacustris sp.]